ncbi:MAG: acylphosphatase [Eubacterium aggregans]|uniref:acylphosphatase n=1 Tax=Eubacterium aggregans TaxID=81409 RepID=A0A1H3X0P9_9FIRM|nr:acylphosphatase [Eubacterium aggregans]MDD4691830.1 acylphosphatase [Eubacterium aggregans]MEA5073565.1 acylphosphatase [Eubacterium aggregans]SDZ92979.1 acylphosphatase [Eubacterium aggregans]
MKRYYIIFEGRVQGVGFRYTAQHLAVSLGLTGWVRNLESGMVDAELQGNTGALDRFLREIKTECGRFICIDDYSVKRIGIVDGETGFKVRY